MENGGSVGFVGLRSTFESLFCMQNHYQPPLALARYKCSKMFCMQNYYQLSLSLGRYKCSLHQCSQMFCMQNYHQPPLYSYWHLKNLPHLPLCSHLENLRKSIKSGTIPKLIGLVEIQKISFVQVCMTSFTINVTIMLRPLSHPKCNHIIHHHHNDHNDCHLVCFMNVQDLLMSCVYCVCFQRFQLQCCVAFKHSAVVGCCFALFCCNVLNVHQ